MWTEILETFTLTYAFVSSWTWKPVGVLCNEGCWSALVGHGLWVKTRVGVEVGAGAPSGFSSTIPTSPYSLAMVPRGILVPGV